MIPAVLSMLLLTSMVWLTWSDSPAGDRLRFHHLHVSTADPSAAMADMLTQTGGRRVILQGLGVGVRIGEQYVLFDRADGMRSDATDGSSAAAKYAAAVRWLAMRNVDVSPAEFAATSVAAIVPAGSLEHVAFATDDLEATVVLLGRAGADPIKRTSESAWFAIGDRDQVEITRESDRPDTFWCPMHPEVRSAGAATCPLCSMELVPIPAPSLGGYELDATQIPRPAGIGTEGLRIQIRHPETSESVSAFSEIHERLLHLFIIGRDLSYFAHVHPEKKGTGFEIPVNLEPGSYVLVADFVPGDGAPQLVQRAIVTPGTRASPFATADVGSDLADKIIDGVRISLTADLRVQKESSLRFSVRDSASGAPLTDLQPYLGAAGHLLVVNTDVTVVIHAHPEGLATGGPEVVFGPVLPAPGIYKMWVQFQRKGTVLTAPFAVVAR